MKTVFITAGVVLVAVAAFYIFYIIPYLNRVEKDIQNAYYRGKSESLTDTVYIKGETKYIERIKKIYLKGKISDVIKDEKDYHIVSSADSTVISGKDTIKTQATISIQWDAVLDTIKNTQWFFKINHKDYTVMPDTIKIKIPKYIEIVKKEANWLYIFISFIAGGIMFLLTKLL